MLCDFFVGKRAKASDAALCLPALSTPFQQEAGEPGGCGPGETEGSQLIAGTPAFEAQLTCHVVTGDWITPQEVEKGLPLDRRQNARHLRFGGYIVRITGRRSS